MQIFAITTVRVRDKNRFVPRRNSQEARGVHVAASGTWNLLKFRTPTSKHEFSEISSRVFLIN